MFSKCLIFPILFTFLASVLSKTINGCKHMRWFPEAAGGGYIDGYINAELDFSRIDDVALIKSIKFHGSLHYPYEPIVDLHVKFESIKAVRVQRKLQYLYDRDEETIKTYCTTGLIENWNIRMGVPYAVQNSIIQIAEECITDIACEFPEHHVMGDDIHVNSRFKDTNWRYTTSQSTLNGGLDLSIAKLTNGFIKAQATVVKFPPFNIQTSVGFGIDLTFSSTGGHVDIFNYFKRIEDLLFINEKRRFIIGTAFELTGGSIGITGVNFTTSLTPPVNGSLTVNMTGTVLRLQVRLDNTKNPCKVHVEQASLGIPSDGADFSNLTAIPKSLTDSLLVSGTKAWDSISGWFSGGSETTTEVPQTSGISIDKALSALPGSKFILINLVSSQLESLIKKSLEEIQCEEFKAVLFQTIHSSATSLTSFKADYLLGILLVGKLLHYVF